MPGSPLATSLLALRDPTCQVTVDWDKNGSFEDNMTADVISIEATGEAVSRDAGGSSVASSATSTARVEIENTSGRYSPSRAGNVVGTYGGYMAPIKIELGFGASYLPQLTGYIIKPQENPGARTVSFDCTDRWIALRRKHLSTPVFRNYRVDQLIAEWLNRSGLTFSSALEKSERVVEWAWMEDDSIADDIIRLVEADGGLVFFDKTGTLIYASATWPARNTGVISPTLSTARFTDLRPTWDFDNVYDEVVVRVRPRHIGLQTAVWSSEDEIAVEANATITVKAQFREPVAALAKPAYVASTAPNWSELTDWIAISSASQVLETAGASQVNVTMLNAAGAPVFNADGSLLNPFEAQSITFSIQNTNASHRVYLQKLQIRGNPIVSVKEFVERAAAPTVPTVTQSLSIDNTYIQNRIHGAAVAKSRCYRHQTPRYELSLKDVPALPHLRVYDRVLVQETATSGVNADFFITRVVHKFPGDGSYKQDIDLVRADQYTPRSDYFVTGVTALGAARLWW